jgi:hypothetical protein
MHIILFLVTVISTGITIANPVWYYYVTRTTSTIDVGRLILILVVCMYSYYLIHIITCTLHKDALVYGYHDKPYLVERSVRSMGKDNYFHCRCRSKI